MTNILDFNKAFEKRERAQTRARELVSAMEDQARPNIAIAEHLRLKALEKPFAQVLLEIEAAQEDPSAESHFHGVRYMRCYQIQFTLARYATRKKPTMGSMTELFPSIYGHPYKKN